jgi:hypothetical protein
MEVFEIQCLLIAIYKPINDIGSLQNCSYPVTLEKSVQMIAQSVTKIWKLKVCFTRFTQYLIA